MKNATSIMGKQMVKERFKALLLVSMDHQPVGQGSLAKQLGLRMFWAMAGEKDKPQVFVGKVLMMSIHPGNLRNKSKRGTHFVLVLK